MNRGIYMSSSVGERNVHAYSSWHSCCSFVNNTYIYVMTDCFQTIRTCFVSTPIHINTANVYDGPRYSRTYRKRECWFIYTRAIISE
jgi:hypothetical protein